MKTRLNIFALAALAVMSFSCTDDFGAEELRARAGQFTATLNCNLEMDQETRTRMDKYYNVIWEASDKLSIFAGTTANTCYSLESGAGSTAAVFAPMGSKVTGTAGLNANYAIYPYSPDTHMDGTTGVIYNLPAVQYYRYNSFGSASNPMVAVTNGVADHSLGFRNICALIRLSVMGAEPDQSISKIKLISNDGYPLWGPIGVWPKPGEDFDPDPLSDGIDHSTLLLDCGDGVALSTEEVTNFIIVIPPGFYDDGFRIKLYGTEGEVKTVNTSGAEVTRNVVYSLGIVSFTPESGNDTIGFLDEEFKAQCVRQADRDGDGELTADEALAVETLIIQGADVRSIDGIEYFKNLTVFRFFGNQAGEAMDRTSGLSEADLSNNGLLRKLLIADAPLIDKVDVSGMPDLEELGLIGLPELKSIDISNNFNLTSLQTARSGIASLDVNHLDKLTLLNVAKSPIRALDLSSNSGLWQLDVEDTPLNSLDVSRCPELFELEMSNKRTNNAHPPIAVLYVARNQVIPFVYNDPDHARSANNIDEETRIEVAGMDDAIQFRDENFKKFLLKYPMRTYDAGCDFDPDCWLDANGDGEITPREALASQILYIPAAKNDITNLDDLEYFTNLEILLVGFEDDGERSEIDHLPLASLVNLWKLSIEYTSFETLDLSVMQNIRQLYAYMNENLSTINLENTTLQLCDVSCNNLRELDTKWLTRVEYLYTDCNPIEAIDLTPCRMLKSLILGNNRLTGIDLSSCDLLEEAYLHNNDLTELELGSKPYLSTLYVMYNRIASLDVSGCPKLTDLRLAPMDDSERNNLLEVLYVTYDQVITGICDAGDASVRDARYIPQATRIEFKGEQYIKFEDPAFEAFLLGATIDNKDTGEPIDANGDGRISFTEAERVTEIDALLRDTEDNVRSLAGLEHFTNLEVVQVLYPNGRLSPDFTKLDLSPLKSLRSFAVRGYSFESLDLSKNPELSQFVALSCVFFSPDFSNDTLLALSMMGCGAVNDIDEFKQLLADENADATMVDWADLVLTNPKLENLVLDESGFGMVDITKCPNLKTLEIDDVFAKDVYVMENIEDNLLECEINLMEDVNLHHICNFADPRMHQAVISTEGTDYDKDGNGLLDMEEALDVTLIMISPADAVSSFVSDQEGCGRILADYFPYLEGFAYGDIRAAQMSHAADINLTGLPYLKSIVIASTDAASLDFSSNLEAQNIMLVNNKKLTNLNMPASAAAESELYQLRVVDCDMEKLDLGWHENLISLDISGNKLTEFDFSGITNLEFLNCCNNNFKTLDVTKLPSLETLDCSPMTVSLDTLYVCDGQNISKVCKVSGVVVDESMRSVDYIPANTVIEVKGPKFIKFDDDEFKAVMLQQSIADTHFMSVDVDGNGEIDFDEALALKRLNYPNYFSFKSLGGLEHFTNLESINLGSGRKYSTLTKYDFTPFKNLKELTLQTIDLKSGINVTANTELEYLTLNECELYSVDITNNTKLVSLDLGDNYLSFLDLSKNTELVSLNVEFNNLSYLNIRNNTKLNSLDMYPMNDPIKSSDYLFLNGQTLWAVNDEHVDWSNPTQWFAQTGTVDPDKTRNESFGTAVIEDKKFFFANYTEYNGWDFFMHYGREPWLNYDFENGTTVTFNVYSDADFTISEPYYLDYTSVIVNKIYVSGKIQLVSRIKSADGLVTTLTYRMTGEVDESCYVNIVRPDMESVTTPVAGPSGSITVQFWKDRH